MGGRRAGAARAINKGPGKPPRRGGGRITPERKGRERRMWTATLIGLALASLLVSTTSPQAAMLESPAGAAPLSGIGFISGWKCDAENITVTIDGGEHLPVAMHQECGDLRFVCGGTSATALSSKSIGRCWAPGSMSWWRMRTALSSTAPRSP